MTRVLVVWEDRHWKPLDAFAKQLVRILAPTPDTEIPRVLGHTAYGNGGFDRYVSQTWTRVRPVGQPGDAGAIDHLVCVVDGDRLHDLLPTQVSGPPSGVDAVATWHVAAERAFQSHLRARCDPGGPPASTVHGVVLRWAKESLLLAGYDQPAMEAVDVPVDHPEVAAALGRCKPRPQQVDAARFTDTFRHPFDCVNLLRKARDLTPLHKSAPGIDDALRALVDQSQSLGAIRERAPDVGRIAALVWRLHAGQPEGPAAVEAAPKPQPRKKPARAKR